MTTLVPAWIDGELTPVEKLDVHLRGLRHKAISVFLIAGDAVLLQRRALGKYHTPGLWANTCCTHPFWDEASLDCAERRLREELGITGVKLRHCDQVEYRADVGNSLIEHEVVEIYRGDVPADLAMSLNPAEVMEARWVSITALRDEVRDHPDRFTPWLRIYLAEHAARIFDESESNASALTH